jgi:hypothetical protein
MQEHNGKEKENGSASPNQSGLSWSEPTVPPAPKPVTPTTAPSVVAPAVAAGMSAAKLTGMIVVGVIVGIVVAWAWVALRNSGTTASIQNNNNSTGGTTTTQTVGQGSDPALTIASPQKAGKSVAVEKAIVSVPTWIVVYENRDGKPGNALGAALFFPSRQTGSVELLRATTAGKTYLIAKQTDNGDRKFSLRNDPLVSEGGAVQWVTLQIQ